MRASFACAGVVCVAEWGDWAILVETDGASELVEAIPDLAGDLCCEVVSDEGDSVDHERASLTSSRFALPCVLRAALDGRPCGK